MFHSKNIHVTILIKNRPGCSAYIVKLHFIMPVDKCIRKYECKKLVLWKKCLGFKTQILFCRWDAYSVLLMMHTVVFRRQKKIFFRDDSLLGGKSLIQWSTLIGKGSLYSLAHIHLPVAYAYLEFRSITY